MDYLLSLLISIHSVDALIKDDNVLDAFRLSFVLGKEYFNTFIVNHKDIIDKIKPLKVGDIMLCVWRSKTCPDETLDSFHIGWVEVDNITNEHVVTKDVMCKAYMCASNMVVRTQPVLPSLAYPIPSSLLYYKIPLSSIPKKCEFAYSKSFEGYERMYTRMNKHELEKTFEIPAYVKPKDQGWYIMNTFYPDG